MDTLGIPSKVSSSSFLALCCLHPQCSPFHLCQRILVVAGGGRDARMPVQHLPNEPGTVPRKMNRTQVGESNMKINGDGHVIRKRNL